MSLDSGHPGTGGPLDHELLVLVLDLAEPIRALAGGYDRREDQTSQGAGGLPWSGLRVLAEANLLAMTLPTI